MDSMESPIIEANIYQLASFSLEKALPKLVEAMVAKGNRVLIYCKDQAQIQELDEVLWSFAQLSFIPHGTKDDLYPEDQHVLITDRVEDNKNNANIIVLVSENFSDAIKIYHKIILMFEQRHIDQAKTAALKLKQIGIQCHYIQQLADGSWKKNNDLIV